MTARRSIQIPEPDPPETGWRRARVAPSLAEVYRSVPIVGHSKWRKMLAFAGPGYLVAVGYMDPGNWATDLAGGSRFGYALLSVILISNLMAVLLQGLSSKLGIVTGRDLAQACRDHYSTPVVWALWLLCEIAIAACDLAEVIGSAIALNLLFGIALPLGVAITGLDVLLLLYLQNKGVRVLEALVITLVMTVGVCFAFELFLARPDMIGVAKGFIPTLDIVTDREKLYIAIGILGATVMPHNLYLHSSIVQTRLIANDDRSRRDAIRLSTLDTVVSLSLALLVNAAILALAASAFHSTGHQQVADLQDAYHLLDPLVGGALASVLFGLALLAAGQSSTFTGTIAGQIVLEGFLDLKIPCWQRRLATRALALVPAFLGVLWLGDAGVGALLVGSQVVLSLQLPFAIWPLLRATSDRTLMGVFANGPWLKFSAWGLLALISVANLWLLMTLVS